MPQATILILKNWRQRRWNWKRAVRQDQSISDAAKVLAAALCDDFAHHETGYCIPGTDTLAEALGKDRRSVQRAMRQLREAGWIVTEHRRGSKDAARIFFAMAEETSVGSVASVAHRDESEDRETADKSVALCPETGDRSVAAQARSGDTCGATGDRSVVSPCTPYKDKPRSNQRAPSTSDCPAPHLVVCIKPGSPGDEAWTEWATERGWPTHRQTNIRCSDAAGVGWNLPFSYPPNPDDEIGTSIAEKRAMWAWSCMEERASA